MNEPYVLKIRKGRTLNEVFRYAQPVKSYAAISAASLAAPCIVTAAAHGLPPDWPFAITGAKGMTQINKGDLDANEDLYLARNVTANTVELNNINAINYAAYTGGGAIEYFTPVDLSIYTGGLAQIRPSIDSTTVLHAFVFGTGLIVDNANKKIKLFMSDEASAAIDTVEGAVYDIELVTSTGDTDVLVLESPVEFIDEVSRA